MPDRRGIRKDAETLSALRHHHTSAAGAVNWLQIALQSAQKPKQCGLAIRLKKGYAALSIDPTVAISIHQNVADLCCQRVEREWLGHHLHAWV